MYDLIIAGSGPAGLSAAVYASNARMNFIVIEKYAMSGGQILNTYDINNYLGFESTDGFSLGQTFRKHAEKAGAEFVNDEIKEIVRTDEGFTVKCGRAEYESRALIVATGANPSKLGVPGEAKFTGRGVSYCATCDGNFFRNRKTAVVGGGDVALEDALYLANICESVTLIHRRDEFRGAKYLQEKVRANEKINILYSTQVKEIVGDKKVEGILLDNGETLAVDGVFLAVGIKANSEILEGVCELERGFAVADESCRTSCDGLFAAGDIRTKRLRQVSTAVADGANAVHSVEEYFLGKR